MDAAAKEPKVKSLVYTSSSTAALIPQPDKIIKISKDTWDDSAVQEAKSEPNAWNVYSASKTGIIERIRSLDYQRQSQF